MTTLNIADDMFKPKDPGGKSPDSFQSQKRRRGPLGKDWQDTDTRVFQKNTFEKQIGGTHHASALRLV